MPQPSSALLQWWWLVPGLALACVGDGTGLDPIPNPTGCILPSAGVSFCADVQPIFTASCAFSGCHAGPAAQLGQNLSVGNAYASIVNVPSVEVPALDRVEPGDPDASYLVHKIEGTFASVGGSGGRMPLGQGALPQADIDVIRAWIAAGAPNN
jgi:hypothetical protein